MERTRKRPKEKSLRASNDLKKSKLRNSFVKAFSASGAADPDEGQVCKTDHKTTSNGGNGRTGKTKLDSSWRDGSCSSTGGSTFVGSATLKDQSKEFKKDDDNPEENKVKTDLLAKRNGTPTEAGLKKSLKQEKGGHEESEKTKQAQNQQSKSYTCACGKSYTSSSHLRRHQKTHVEDDVSSGQHFGEPGKSFPCLCGKSYTISSHLYRHQKTCQAGSMTHLDSDAGESRLKPYICACGKCYTSSSHLYRHQRSHLDENKESAKTYICDCGKMFRDRSHLLRHQKTHAQEKVQIEECGGGSAEVIETKAPERMKPYVCLCGKSYTSSSHLYRHQRTHQEENFCTSSRYRAAESKKEKPYKCECGKSYTSSSHLYRHQRTHETMELVVDDPDCDSDVHNEDFGEKPYQCECGKSFILWFSLMVHKRIHCKAKLQSSSGQGCP